MNTENYIPQSRWEKIITPENRILFLLILFTIFFRLLTIINIETGGDAAGVWFYAKKIFYGLSYDTWNHHSARFGMIIPVYLIQTVFGTHPVVYYITPLLFFILQVIFLYKIGVRVHSIPVAFFSCILLIFFPQMLRHAVQIKPGGFCATYILIGLYFLFKFQDSEDTPSLFLILSSVLLFLAYLTKITTLFFVPGILIAIWMLRRRLRDVMLYCTVLLLLFFCETAFYYYVADIPMGRIGIIMGSHLASGNLQPLASFWSLFERYTSMIFYWKIYAIAYLVATAFLVGYSRRLEVNVKIKSVLLITFGFFLFLTFAVKGIDPLVPAMSFNHRHLVLAAPLMILIISYFFIEVFHYFKDRIAFSQNSKFMFFFKRENEVARYAVIAAFLTIFCLISFIIILPYFPKYTRDNFFGDNPIRLAFSYHSTLNRAYNRGIPIVQEKVIPKRFKERVEPVEALLKDGYTLEDACIKAGIAESDYFYSLGRVKKGDYKAFKIFTRIFWDGDFSIKDDFSFPKMEKVMIENRTIGFMLKREYKKEKNYRSSLFTNMDRPVIELLTKPFRVKQMSVEEFLK